MSQVFRPLRLRRVACLSDGSVELTSVNPTIIRSVEPTTLRIHMGGNVLLDLPVTRVTLNGKEAPSFFVVGGSGAITDAWASAMRGGEPHEVEWA